jgi:hypothetical protein
MSSSPLAKLGVSPASIVLDAESAPQQSRLPDVSASKMPKCVTVPHDAVAWGKVIAVPLLFAPPEAAGQFVASFVTLARA